MTFSEMLHSVMMFLFFSLLLYTLTAIGATCDPGLYGRSCKLKCSLGCRDRKCMLVRDGTAPCTDGCEPGWYGSQCKLPCHPPGDSCQKCPSKCEGGFCQLGSRCVSGCVDSYYGTGCFTCGLDCQVCNKHTERCYNCEDGCPFSSCRCESGTVNHLRKISFWVMLTFASGVCVFVFLTVLVLGFSRATESMKTNEQPSELGQALRLDRTEENDASRTSGNESYIHAIPNPYDECSEQ